MGTASRLSRATALRFPKDLAQRSLNRGPAIYGPSLVGSRVRDQRALQIAVAAATACLLRRTTSSGGVPGLSCNEKKHFPDDRRRGHRLREE